MFPKSWLLMATLYATSIFRFVKPFPKSDKILILPGQPEVNFKQFSGFITVDENPQRSLFYYFVEAKNNPASGPLVLWLNGGPGCSSIGAGEFCEHGPFKPSGDILVENDFSWNKEANMLYLESPAGVGFTYSNDASFYDSIGNPLLEFNNDFKSRGEYLCSHGLISDATNDLLNRVCNYSQIRRQSQTNSLTPHCRRINVQMRQKMSKFVDSYDVTLDVCLPSVSSQEQVLNQAGDKKGIDVCVEDETIMYLNRDDVQKALHAQLVGVTSWSTCSEFTSPGWENSERDKIAFLGG